MKRRWWICIVCCRNLTGDGESTMEFTFYLAGAIAIVSTNV